VLVSGSAVFAEKQRAAYASFCWKGSKKEKNKGACLPGPGAVGVGGSDSEASSMVDNKRRVSRLERHKRLRLNNRKMA
jgi:hypothetical protein